MVNFHIVTSRQGALSAEGLVITKHLTEFDNDVIEVVVYLVLVVAFAKLRNLKTLREDVLWG